MTLVVIVVVIHAVLLAVAFLKIDTLEKQTAELMRDARLHRESHKEATRAGWFVIWSEWRGMRGAGVDQFWIQDFSLHGGGMWVTNPHNASVYRSRAEAQRSLPPLGATPGHEKPEVVKL